VGKTAVTAAHSCNGNPLRLLQRGSLDLLAQTMAAALRLAAVQEALSCSVCLNAYSSESSARPVSLPCLHTFCNAVRSAVVARTCRAVNITQDPALVAALCTLTGMLIALDHWQCVEKLRTDTCPDCRKPFSRDDQTRFNISLLHVIDALAEGAGDDGIFLCKNHESALKSYFCLECRVECCADCVISGAHREHTKSVKRCDKLQGVQLERINQEAQALVRSACDLEDKLQVLCCE
jgi:hypothetical protein